MSYQDKRLEKYNELISQGVDADQAGRSANEYIDQLIQEDKCDNADRKHNERMEDSL